MDDVKVVAITPKEVRVVVINASERLKVVGAKPLTVPIPIFK